MHFHRRQIRPLALRQSSEWVSWMQRMSELNAANEWVECKRVQDSMGGGDLRGNAWILGASYLSTSLRLDEIRDCAVVVAEDWPQHPEEGRLSSVPDPLASWYVRAHGELGQNTETTTWTNVRRELGLDSRETTTNFRESSNQKPATLVGMWPMCSLRRRYVFGISSVTWPICVVGTWSVCGRCVADMWPVRGRCVADMWSVRRRYVVDTSLRGRSDVGTSSARDW